jgi:hypothetical protein
MAREVNNSEDILDSRDIIARLEELREERESLDDDRHDAQEAHNALSEGDIGYEDAGDDLAAARQALRDWDADNGAELKALEDLAKEAEGYAPDWHHGETLIRDSYFKEYAMELAEDLGAIDNNASWPMTCIDWEQAARELQMDYTAVDFDGVTYWIR